MTTPAAKKSPPHEILVGTSGYSFADWVGPFYPPGMKSGDFLGFYARHFDVVEVNSTYYGIPHPRVLEQMEKKTPAHFRFVVKLNQAMTHESAQEHLLYREFLAVLEPLKSAGKYDGLLAQFPWGFRRTPRALDHLKFLREMLPGEPLWVEFRNDSWVEPTVLPFLREHALGYCAVDEPALRGLMPRDVALTTDQAYVRFHGRNARNWWARPEKAGTAAQRVGTAGAGFAGGSRAKRTANQIAKPVAKAPLFEAPAAEEVSGEAARAASQPARAHTSSDRYDYDYSAAELGEWVKRIAELSQQAKRTYLFFNNCHAGQAARNAALMKELLRQQKLPA
jgi:uncharacterized protein YecE (DUF72 family)